MRIAFVHDRWSALGGADWHLISLWQNLPSELTVTGLFGRSDGSVPLQTWSGRRLFIRKLDKKAPFAAETRVGLELRQHLQRLEVDLIHIHNILNPHLLETLARTGPTVMTVQDHRFFCPGRGKVTPQGRICRQPWGEHCAPCFDEPEYFERLSALVRARLSALASMSALIVLSRYMKEELVQAGLKKDKIHVIPPFVHGLENCGLTAAEGTEILFVGRLVQAKGIFDLLKAFSLMDRTYRLVVAGAGTGSSAFISRAEDLDLRDRINLTGWIPHGRLHQLFRRARVSVMPSRWQEPFGIAGLEAQAAGRPVVAYDVGGIKEWLKDRGSGLLVPVGDIEALAASLNEMMVRPDRAAAMGRSGRRISRTEFSAGSLMDQLIQLYERIGSA